GVLFVSIQSPQRVPPRTRDADNTGKPPCARSLHQDRAIRGRHLSRLEEFLVWLCVRYSVEPAPSNLTNTPPVIFDAEALPEAQERPTGTPLWNTSWGNVAPRVAATYQFGTGTAHDTTVRGLWNLGFDDLTAATANVFGSYYPYVSRRVALVSEFP